VKNYTALIIDLKKSKEYDIADRVNLQEYLLECIKNLNQLFEKGIVHNVIFGAGDELQGLFFDTVTAIMYFRLLKIMIYPSALRAGIGIGGWSVRIEGGTSTEQDGPVYHNARNAIEEVYKMQTQDIRIYSGQGNDIWGNHLLNNSNGLLRSQNRTQSTLQLLVEIMYPFYRKKNILTEYVNIMTSILEMKQAFCSDKYRSYNTNLDTNGKIDYNEVKVIDPIYLDKLIQEPENVIIQKGMPGELAKIMNKTRQNIDRVLKRGNIVNIRCMDYMALQFVQANYESEV